jgi:hypothetical protein
VAENDDTHLSKGRCRLHKEVVMFRVGVHLPEKLQIQTKSQRQGFYA